MKPSLIMITGWAHGADSMQPLAELLALDFDIRILTGAQVLAERKIPDADVIIGWSMGGMLALELLPVSCKKLVLISSTARFCATEGYSCGIPEKILRRMIVQLKQNPEAVLTEFYKNVHYPVRRRGFQPRLQNPCTSLAPTRLEASSTLEELVAGLNYLLEADLRATVPSVGIPVLLLHGEKDLIIPPEASDWLAQYLPAAINIRLDGEGHLADALAIAPHIRHFLTKEAL